MARASGFSIYGPQAFLSSRSVSSLSILCYQLGALASKTILIFPRSFFVEVIFKQWILVLAPAMLLIFFFL